MANPQKGEVRFEYGGKVYTLVMNTFALALMQAKFTTKQRVSVKVDGKDVTEERDVIADIEEIDRLIRAKSLRHIIAFFWAALQKYHPEIATEAQAAELIDEAGAQAVAALMEAANLGKVDPKDLEELAKANPLGAQATRNRKRRGAISSSTLARVV